MTTQISLGAQASRLRDIIIDLLILVPTLGTNSKSEYSLYTRVLELQKIYDELDKINYELKMENY